MIKELHLTDYQAHKETSLSLDRGVNVIIGQSDSGKSSLMRGLCTVIENEPSGMYLKRKKAKKKYKVTLINEDNTTITRERTKSSNLYIIDGEEYEGFGVNPPEEVNEILKFKPINIQRQLDDPFLITKSGGEVSRYLNEVADLSIIDTTLKKLTSMKKKNDSDITYAKQDIVALESQIENLPDYDGIEKLVKNLEEIEEDIEYWKEEGYSLSNLKALIENEECELEELKKTKVDTNKIDKVLEAIDNIAYEDEKYGNLVTLVDEIEELEERIKSDKEELNKVEEEYHELNPDICPLCGK